jgi:hypothetical protein
MNILKKAALSAAMLAALVTSVPADAGVKAIVHIGPRPAVWYGPPGRCGVFRYDNARPFGPHWRNCGYLVSHGPIFIDGRWRQGPFYYSYRYGERWYWWQGAWRRDEWRGVPR